jgi:hypothetical protein
MSLTLLLEHTLRQLPDSLVFNSYVSLTPVAPLAEAMAWQAIAEMTAAR